MSSKSVATPAAHLTSAAFVVYASAHFYFEWEGRLGAGAGLLVLLTSMLVIHNINKYRSMKKTHDFWAVQCFTARGVNMIQACVCFCLVRNATCWSIHMAFCLHGNWLSISCLRTTPNQKQVSGVKGYHPTEACFKTMAALFLWCRGISWCTTNIHFGCQ